MKLPSKSPIVARTLGISYPSLIRLIHTDKIPAPAKDTAGDYWWSDQDIARAKKVVEQRKEEEVQR